ncbi:MAG: hypothetical protein DRK00_01675 [Thermoprotei archaeon]|nr:MAG: hypothetical protein DRK00_01675 [Thermoprotei archaeon]
MKPGGERRRAAALKACGFMWGRLWGALLAFGGYMSLKAAWLDPLSKARQQVGAGGSAAAVRAPLPS